MATINGTSVGGMTLQIDYSYTQNTTANTTSVTAKLQLVSHYALYATALSGSYISVGGSRTDYSKSIDYGGSSTTTTVLATKTVTVSHNNDGTGSCNLSGTFVMNGSYRGYSVGTMSVSSTITLPTIPRSSGLTVPVSVNTGTTLSGSVAPSNSAFNHKVEFKIGSTVKSTLTLAANQTAPTFTQAIGHDWFPNSTSGTINVVLSTYSGTTLIATTSKNVTANVPTSVVPSVSGLTATSSATSGTFANLFVQGKTTVKLTATASAAGGASISSYTYSGPNIGTTITSNTFTTPTIQASGTLTYAVQVTDSRGRTASKTVQISVYPYSAPAMGSVSVQRCDANGNLSESGTYAKYVINSTYSNVGGKNTRTVTAAYSSNNGATYSAVTTLQAATDTSDYKTGTYGGSAFALANTYLIKFTITDAYGATSFTTAQLMSAQRPINIRSNGKGVAIGGMSTKDAFECSFDADFNKNVNIDGKLTLTGGLSSALSIANGGTGATTSDGIAQSHYHQYISVAADGGQSGGYLKIATIKIGGQYVNQGMEIDFIRRGDQFVTTLSILFHGTDNTDPNLAAFTSKGSAIAWLHKTATGTWDVYALKSGWDNMSILNIRKGANNGSVTISGTNVFVASLPSGAIQSIESDFVIETGTSGIWTYRKWNSGVAECWGIYTMTSACNLAWGTLYYSNALAPRINYPFTFTSRPQETVFCRGDSVSAWAYPEGGGIGMNTTTQTGQYGFLRPTTMTEAQVRYEYTVVGRWK